MIPDDVRYSQSFDDEAWDDKWAKRNGYASIEAAEADEKECPNCKGAGYVSNEVSLLDALHALGYVKDKSRCVNSKDELITELRNSVFSQ